MTGTYESDDFLVDGPVLSKHLRDNDSELLMADQLFQDAIASGTTPVASWAARTLKKAYLRIGDALVTICEVCSMLRAWIIGLWSEQRYATWREIEAAGLQLEEYANLGLRQVQEAELSSRGYDIGISGFLPPIARIECNEAAANDWEMGVLQCLVLRRTIARVLVDARIAYGGNPPKNHSTLMPQDMLLLSMRRSLAGLQEQRRQCEYIHSARLSRGDPGSKIFSRILLARLRCANGSLQRGMSQQITVRSQIGNGPAGVGNFSNDADIAAAVAACGDLRSSLGGIGALLLCSQQKAQEAVTVVSGDTRVGLCRESLELMQLARRKFYDLTQASEGVWHAAEFHYTAAARLEQHGVLETPQTVPVRREAAQCTAQNPCPVNGSIAESNVGMGTAEESEANQQKKQGSVPFTEIFEVDVIEKRDRTMRTQNCQVSGSSLSFAPSPVTGVVGELKRVLDKRSNLVEQLKDVRCPDKGPLRTHKLDDQSSVGQKHLISVDVSALREEMQRKLRLPSYSDTLSSE